MALIFGRCLEEVNPCPPSHDLEVSRSQAPSLNPGYDGKSPEEVVPLPPSHDLMISKSQSLKVSRSGSLTLSRSFPGPPCSQPQRFDTKNSLPFQVRFCFIQFKLNALSSELRQSGFRMRTDGHEVSTGQDRRPEGICVNLRHLRLNSHRIRR